MLVADFAIVVAVAIVQTCLAHAALHGGRKRQHPPAGLRWQLGLRRDRPRRRLNRRLLSKSFCEKPEPEQSLASLVRHLQLPFRICFKFADDVAAIVAAKQSRLPPCSRVVRKIDFETGRVCSFALSNFEAVARHIKIIEGSCRTVGTVPDLTLCEAAARPGGLWGDYRDGHFGWQPPGGWRTMKAEAGLVQHPRQIVIKNLRV